eukprot:m.511629 g.511629  ORF g.511629 m.511629 type:complete len:84 (-) comp57430_c1_seq2:108-359(-)
MLLSPRVEGVFFFLLFFRPLRFSSTWGYLCVMGGNIHIFTTVRAASSPERPTTTRAPSIPASSLLPHACASEHTSAVVHEQSR